MSNNSMIDDMIANDPEMLESFINESRECLVVAEKDLKHLREVAGESDPEYIDRAFRSVHSLKSAAGFLGLDNVSNLALHMEGMLGHLRDGTITLEANRINTLLEGVVMLNTMLANPKESSDIDTGEFLVKLSEQTPTHNDQ